MDEFTEPEEMRSQAGELDLRPEVKAELAAAFAREQDSDLPAATEEDLVSVPEADLDAEPELDPTAPALISISDDEFIDPVYIDEIDLAAAPVGLAHEDPAPTSPSGRVVIVDGGEADALVPGASGREGPGRMEPRLRERRISVRRSEGRRRLRWVIAVAAVLLAGVILLAVLGSPLFSIAEEDVVVTGAVYTDQVRLTEIIAGAVGATTLLVDTGEMERRIEEIPWVEMARVSTRFPSGLRIEIRERSPLVTYRGSDALFRVIDKEGRVLDVIEGQPIAYVVVFGLEELTLEPGQFTPPGPVGAAQLAQALTASVRGRTQALEVDPDGEELTMYLSRAAVAAVADPDQWVDDPDLDPLTSERIEVRFGAASDLLVKLLRLETVLPAALSGDVSFIDVSTATVTVR